MTIHQRIVLVLITVCLIPALARTVAACTCVEYGTPPCVAYGRADAVFVGVVTGIKEPAREAAGELPEALVSFSVEQSFKGVAASLVQVATLWGTSCDSSFQMGGRYLVYAHKNSSGGRLVIQACDRTALFEQASEDLDYIRSLTGSAPTQSIIGRVAEQKYSPLHGVNISVTGGGKSYQAVTDVEGRFNIEVSSPGSYKVRASVPFSAAVISYRPGVEARATERRTVFEYTVKVEKGQCDYRELEIHKVDLKATAEIGGRVTSVEGKPVPQLTVYLYPAMPGQTFSNSDYEFARTDGEGRYTFSGLRGGHFWVGVNPGRTPEVESPYPTTFHPGVPDVDAATTVILEDGQKLSAVNIRLPPKLVEREVTGLILWPDGTPVTRLSPDAVPGVGPVLSIRDPQRLWYPLNPRRADGTNTVTTDEQGRFSFIGFDGYTYVIHVHAFNAQDQVFHAKPVKLTISDQVKPLRLVLSLPGYGEGKEEVLRELNGQP
ncbi:MAG TPA: carboxypeptidase-like regulatory domain-containing protein [Pyrinomonadaceae bacterium]|nr:carboxypeptidase-like regulatory domain-containing protein [Pyrinomonadaceae bacterium]